MGIVEMIRVREIKAIHEAGIEEGIEEGIKKGKAEVVKNLLATNKFTTAEIANFVGVTKDYVLKAKKALK